MAPRIDLLTCMRDEAPFVVEFVAHHLVLGFSRVLVASNDCTDGTDALLDALAAAGAIRHLRNPVRPGGLPQREGYRRLRRAFGVDRSDWAMALDADEFLNVHAGDRSLAALLAEVPDAADIVSLSSATFGPRESAPAAGTQCPPSAPVLVTRRFLHAVPPRHRANGPVKSLFRAPADWEGFQNHSPVGYRGPKRAPVILGGDGALWEAEPDVPLWRQVRHFPPGRIGHRLAQVNHYATKSWQDFRLRIARGRGAAPLGTPNTRHDRAYFDRIATAAARREETILGYAAAVDALMAALRSDAGVARAEAEALKRHGARLAALGP